jgi:hypothetical protein
MGPSIYNVKKFLFRKQISASIHEPSITFGNHMLDATKNSYFVKYGLTIGNLEPLTRYFVRKRKRHHKDIITEIGSMKKCRTNIHSPIKHTSPGIKLPINSCYCLFSIS